MIGKDRLIIPAAALGIGLIGSACSVPNSSELPAKPKGSAVTINLNEVPKKLPPEIAQVSQSIVAVEVHRGIDTASGSGVKIGPHQFLADSQFFRGRKNELLCSDEIAIGGRDLDNNLQIGLVDKITSSSNGEKSASNVALLETDTNVETGLEKLPDALFRDVPLEVGEEVFVGSFSKDSSETAHYPNLADSPDNQPVFIGGAYIGKYNGNETIVNWQEYTTGSFKPKLPPDASGATVFDANGLIVGIATKAPKDLIPRLGLQELYHVDITPRPDEVPVFYFDPISNGVKDNLVATTPDPAKPC